jgi:hypothetical protein
MVKMVRTNIDPFKGLQDAIFTMSEENPGAITVLGTCLKEQGQMNFMMGTLLHLDDMNIRGSQIWIAFKDYCGENLESFIELVKQRDPNMVDMVNQASLKGWTGTQCKAVTQGASFSSGRTLLGDNDKYLLEKEIPLPDLPEE